MPEGAAVEKAFDVLAADERDVLAKPLAVDLKQGVAVPGLLGLHLFKNLGRGRVRFAESLGEVAIDPAILLFQGDRQGEDFALGEVFEVSCHRGSSQKVRQLLALSTELCAPAPDQWRAAEGA